MPSSLPLGLSLPEARLLLALLDDFQLEVAEDDMDSAVVAKARASLRSAISALMKEGSAHG